MNFSFPDNCFFKWGTVYNALGDGYEPIDINTPKDNLITIGSTEYCFTYLNGGTIGNKGGNSVILKLYEAQNLDMDNPNYEEPDKILKISNFTVKRGRNGKIKKNEQRFINEVECLKKAENKSDNIIRIYEHGECSILNQYNKMETHLFYTMEYAPYDLKSYIENSFPYMDLENKVALCLSLCQGLSQLYEMNIYHRDIKPDNIFFTHDNVWKIGDLGLATNEGRDLDEIAEFVGPKGWLSPESMNKYLSENKGFPISHNCTIDHQSDIFQLGKVFWYIFQYNSPEGCIRESDFQVKDSRLYQIIRTMLNYSKIRRFKKIDEVIVLLKIVENNILKKKAA